MICEIDFKSAQTIWSQGLWKDSVVWKKKYSKKEINNNFDNYLAQLTISYWVYKDGEDVVGINSGYVSTKNYFRSRGLWVSYKYRGQGIYKLLLDKAIEKSVRYKCKYIWSYPRKESLFAYEKVGFKKQGGFIKDTFGLNCMVIKEND